MKELNKGMLWYNLKLLPWINLVICILSILAIQIFFSLKRVDFNVMANIGELFVSLTGIILIPGLAFVEENSDAKEIIFSKAVSPVVPSVIRMVYSIILLLLCVLIFVETAVIQGSVFDEFAIIAGVFISALILGSSGYITGCITGNIALAYLIPFAWYGFEFFTRGKHTGDFYLFSLQKGYLADGKWVLLGAAILFILASLTYTGSKRSLI